VLVNEKPPTRPFVAEGWATMMVIKGTPCAFVPVLVKVISFVIPAPIEAVAEAPGNTVVVVRGVNTTVVVITDVNGDP